MASKKITNINGSAMTHLKAVPYKDTSDGLFGKAVNAAPKAQRELVAAVMNVIRKAVQDQGRYQMNLDSKLSDVVLGRICSLLDEVKNDFAKNELAEVKDAILSEISGFSVGGAVKTVLAAAVTSAFTNTATKDDIDELKEYLESCFQSGGASPKETVGEYSSLTPAANFQTLQNFVECQLAALSVNIEGMVGRSSSQFKVLSGIQKCVGGFANILKLSVGGVANLVAKTAAGVVKGVSLVTKGIIGAVGGGIAAVAGIVKGVGSTVGGFFKGFGSKVGGMLSALNPFKRRKKSKEEKLEEKKQALRDKMFSFITKIVDKIWNFVEPILNKISLFLTSTIMLFLIPILPIAAAVAGITLAVVGIGIALYLCWDWIKEKAKELWDYISSGKIWTDIWDGIVGAFEWVGDKIADFFIWIGDKIADLGKYIWQKFKDFGNYLWDKLCEFGDWLWTEYIQPVYDPIKKVVLKIWDFIQKIWKDTIWPAIEPFVASLMNLKDRIVNIFSGWDDSKGFFENLQTLMVDVKEAVLEWWNESSFKEFYDAYLDPIVKDLGRLYDNIMNIFSDWDPNASFLDNIAGIWDRLKQTVAEWWKDSSVKVYYDKLVDYLSDLLKPIREWYENSKLKEWIDKASEKLKDVAKITWKLPMVGYMRPFGPMDGLPVFLSKEESAAEDAKRAAEEAAEKAAKEAAELQARIDKLTGQLASGDTKGWFGRDNSAAMQKELAQLKARQLAQSQVAQQMQPINKMEEDRREAGQEISVAQQEAQREIKQKQNADAADKQRLEQAMQDMNGTLGNVYKAMQQPAKDPAPIVYPFPFENRNILQAENF